MIQTFLSTPPQTKSMRPAVLFATHPTSLKIERSREKSPILRFLYLIHTRVCICTRQHSFVNVELSLLAECQIWAHHSDAKTHREFAILPHQTVIKRGKRVMEKVFSRKLSLLSRSVFFVLLLRLPRRPSSSRRLRLKATAVVKLLVEFLVRHKHSSAKGGKTLNSVILGRPVWAVEWVKRERWERARKIRTAKTAIEKWKGWGKRGKKLWNSILAQSRKKTERKNRYWKKREQIQTTRLFLAVQFTSSPQHNDQQFHHYQ